MVIKYIYIFFQKDETVEFYREKFAGSQADRFVKAEAEAQEMAEQLKKTKVSGNALSVFLLSLVNSLIVNCKLQFFFFF